MISSENISIVRRWNEAIWLGESHIYDEVIHPDCIFHRIGGRQEVEEIVNRFRSSFPDACIEIKDQFAVDDKVVTRWLLTGTHKGPLWGSAPTGKTVTYTGITIDRMQAGKIVEEWSETDLLGIMEQLGMLNLWCPRPSRTPLIAVNA